MKIALPDLLRRDLDARLPADVDAAWYHAVGDVAAAAHDADVLVIGFIDPYEVRAAIDAAPNARWVSTHAAGVDHYPLDGLRQRAVLLTKGAGVNAPPIAEFIVLCILSAAKGFPGLVGASLRREWPSERSPALELHGSRALILGYGNIGRELDARLQAFGVQVTGVHRHDAWRDRLGEFEWIVVTAALTNDSYHMVGEPEFEKMREDAWIVNVSRGGLIDHDALAQAIQGGRPRGAYLDVTEPEPLPRGHALWTTPNVVITGHSAGRSERSRGRYVTLFLDNLQRFQNGHPLRNLVDLSAGY